MPLTLLLRCRDLEEAREFYRSVLDFDVFDSAGGTLTVEKQGGRLIFTPADLWDGSLAFSGTIYFSVTNADSYFASVKTKSLWFGRSETCRTVQESLALRTAMAIIWRSNSRRPNQSMKPTAPLRSEFSVLATTPCRGLSLSRWAKQAQFNV